MYWGKSRGNRHYEGRLNASLAGLAESSARYRATSSNRAFEVMMSIGRTFEERDASLVPERGFRTRRSTRHYGPASSQTVSLFVHFGDLLAMMMAGAVTHFVSPYYGVQLPIGCQVLLTLAAVISTSFVIRASRAAALELRTSINGSLVPRGIALFIGAGAMAFCAQLLPLDEHAVSCWPLLWLVSAMMFVAVAHVAFVVGSLRLLAFRRFTQRIAVVGLNELSARLLERLNESHALAEIVGLYRDDEDPRLSEYAGRPVAGRIEDIVAHGRDDRIDAVVLAMPLTDLDRIARARAVLRTIVSDVYLTTDLAGLHFHASQIQNLGSTPVVNICPRPLDSWQALQKTLFDRSLAAVLLVVLAPLLLLIALLIKCTSPGPVLFRQPRLGFNHATFKIYKFRTMYASDTDLLANRQTTRGDPRITPLGRILRKVSLDELPQLFNVLNGSMSLVGPRPHAPNTKAGDQLFHDAVADYALRHRVKPGITGWAQVNGWRGETRTLEQIRQRVAHDLYYIENWSLAFDIRIMFLTLAREITSKIAF